MAEKFNISVASFFKESDFSHCGPGSHLSIGNCFRKYVYRFFKFRFFSLALCAPETKNGDHRRPCVSNIGKTLTECFVYFLTFLVCVLWR